MKYYISSQKLQLIINELGEEYKDLLIEKMLNDYQTTDVDNLPVSELLKLDVSIKENLVQNKQLEKRNYIYKITVSLGLMYSMFGIFLLFFQELKSISSTEPLNTLSLLFIIIGLFVSFFGIMFKSIILKRRTYRPTKNNFQDGYELISLWKELEGLMLQLFPDTLFVPTPSRLIQYLSENNFISAKDENSIKTLLRLRNEAVHNPTSHSLKLSHEEYFALVKDIKNIICKLNSII